MRSLLRWTAALVTGALLGETALAGDWPVVRQVNFSADSRRVLVLTGHVQDGSGFPEATLHLLDTGTGRTLSRQSLTSQDPAVTPSDLLGRLLRTQSARLQAAGIDPARASKPRYVAPAPTLPRWSDALKAGESRTQPVFLWSRPVPFVLKVQRTAAACAFPDLLPGGERPARYTLSVNGQVVSAPGAPAAPCAARYLLERVDLRGNRVLVTLRAYQPGFEGPTALPVFVAATLR